jgi:hypothetical protein
VIKEKRERGVQTHVEGLQKGGKSLKSWCGRRDFNLGIDNKQVIAKWHTFSLDWHIFF